VSGHPVTHPAKSSDGSTDTLINYLIIKKVDRKK